MVIVQSTDPDIETLKCPKCGALWRAKGHYSYDDGGWVYDEGRKAKICPNRCYNIFGFFVRGDRVIKF